MKKIGHITSLFICLLSGSCNLGALEVDHAFERRVSSEYYEPAVPVEDDIDQDGVRDHLDCAPYDHGKQMIKELYIDQDMDGFGGKKRAVVCTSEENIPVGFSNNDLDCNDKTSALSPGLEEVYMDGIDNDCDGEIF